MHTMLPLRCFCLSSFSFPFIIGSQPLTDFDHLKRTELSAVRPSPSRGGFRRHIPPPVNRYHRSLFSTSRAKFATDLRSTPALVRIHACRTRPSFPTTTCSTRPLIHWFRTFPFTTSTRSPFFKSLTWSNHLQRREITGRYSDIHRLHISSTKCFAKFQLLLNVVR